MKRGGLRFIAIFMSILVLTLPLISAQNLAGFSNSGTGVFGGSASIKIEKLSGENSNLKSRFIKPNDLITLETTAFILSDDEISKDQIEISVNGIKHSADSCKILSGKLFKCVYSERISSAQGEIKFLLSLFDDSKNLLSSTSDSVFVDSVGPEIKKFDFEKNTINSDKLSVDFTIVDYGASLGDASSCAGLSKLNIYVNNGEAILEKFLSGCFVEDSLEFSISSDVRDLSICARATDKFANQGREVCESLKFDNAPPQIKNLRVKKDGVNLGFLNSFNPIFVVIESEITDLDINKDDVFLSFNDGEWFSPVSVDANIFRWQGIKIDDPKACTVKISASDIAGNKAEKIFDCGVEVDVTGPVVESFSSNFQGKGNLPLIAKNNTVLSISFIESGAGISKDSVFLDLSELDLKNRVKPDLCDSNTCYWSIVPKVKVQGEYSISVHSSSADLIGNKVSGELSQIVELDFKMPEIVNLKLSPKNPSWKEDISLSFEVQNINSEPIVNIFAQNISSNPAPFPGNCIEIDDNKFKCRARISNIKQVFSKGDLRIKVEETSGKYVEQLVPVKVFDFDSESIPDLYVLKYLDFVPSRIDAQVASLSGFKLFIKTEFVSTSDSAQIGKKTVSCAESTSKFLVEAPTLMNSDSNSPLILLTFGPQIANATSLVLDCKIDMAVISGTTIMANSETENITTILNIYNNDLGSINDNINSKTRLIKTEIDDLQDKIDNYNQIIEIFGLYCQLAKIIGEVDSALTAAKTVIMGVLTLVVFFKHVTGEGLEKGVLTTGVGKAVINIARGLNALNWGALSEGLGTALEYLQDFVWPSGIIPANGIQVVGMISKFSCMIFMDCMLANWDFASVIASSVLASNLKVSRESETVEFKDGSSKTTFNKDLIFDESGVGITQSRLDSASQTLAQTSAWTAKGKGTDLPFETNNWIFNPYSSIHYAEFSACLPAIKYNLEKDRQVKCLYKSCLSAQTDLGISPDVCDSSYSQRECLYVESAQYKVHGMFPPGMFNKLWVSVLQGVASIATGSLLSLACGDFSLGESPDALSEGAIGSYTYGDVFRVFAKITLCGLSETANMIVQFSDAKNSKYAFGQYEGAELEVDYCK